MAKAREERELVSCLTAPNARYRTLERLRGRLLGEVSTVSSATTTAVEEERIDRIYEVLKT